MRGKSYVEEAEQVEGARVEITGRASRVDTVAGTRRGEVEARGWCVGFQKSMSCGAVVARPGWWVAGRGRSRRRVTRRWTNREASGAEGGREAADANCGAVASSWASGASGMCGGGHRGDSDVNRLEREEQEEQEHGRWMSGEEGGEGRNLTWREGGGAAAE